MKKSFVKIISLVLCCFLALGILAACVEEEPQTKQQRVTFILNEGSSTIMNAPPEQNVEDGSTATRPSSNPGRDGYNFIGWYEDEELTVEFDFSTKIIQRTFIYAKWEKIKTYYDVSYDLNYTDAPQTDSDKVESGQPAVSPEQPERGGYRFLYWSKNADGTDEYSFGVSGVTGSFTLYAVWQKVWTLTFDFNYEGSPDAVEVTVDDKGSAVTRAPSVTGLGPVGWSFGGWHEDKECLIEADIGYVTAGGTVYAKWFDPTAVETNYTVTFNFNYTGAPEPEEQTVLEGSSANRPSDPERDNWRFGGWYTAATGGSAYSFGGVTGDRTVYARWIAVYRLNYNYAGSPPSAVSEFADGSLIPVKPSNPVRPNDPDTGYGYTFAGWSTEPNGDPDFNGFGSAFAGDLTLYAQWEHKYVFEAEHTDLDNIVGSSISGAPPGPGIIVKETNWQGSYPNADASNGYYLSYLYAKGIKVFFEIVSDRSTTATFWVRLSNEFEPMWLTDESYLITVNGEKVNYEPFYPADFEDGDDDYWYNLYGLLKPFNDFFGFTVELTEGLNVIELTTNNNDMVGAMLSATAPVLDCIKLETVAKLTWTPKLSNLSRFQ